MFEVFFDSDLFKWVLLPLLIVLSRVVDVTLGTIRIIYIARGMRYLAPFFGFFEILVWLLAIGQIMRNLTNPLYYLAYAVGFTLGNFVGILVEERLAIGSVVIRIITQKDSDTLIDRLRGQGYGVTVLNAIGSTGMVKVIFTIVKRKNLEEVIDEVRQYNPKAFFSVEDVRTAREGIFPPAREGRGFLRSIQKGQRKGK